MLFRNVVLSCVVLLFGCQQAVDDTTSETQPKLIALTYDDAPLGAGPRFTGVDRTNELIRQLDDAETGPVAIFVTTRGTDIPAGKQRISNYADAGHRIANHSDQHAWASRTLTEDYIADLDRAEAKLEGFANRRPWFRFPFLDEGGMSASEDDATKRDALREALKARDLISGYVTIDTYDWHLDQLWSHAVKDGKSVNMDALSTVYVEMVLDAARHYDALGRRVLDRRPAQVLLLHENDLAASFTIDLVDALRADGWTIIDPDLAFADPIAAQMPVTRYSGGGRISALAADAGLRQRSVLDHWSVSQDAIEARVSDYEVFAEPVVDPED